MPLIGSLTSFSNGTIAQGPEVNANFSTVQDTVNAYCLFRDVAGQSVTVAVSWTQLQTLTGGFSAGAASAVTTGGLTVAGGVTVSSGTTAVQALTATTGAFSGVLSLGSGATSTVAIDVTGGAAFRAIDGAVDTRMLSDLGNTRGVLGTASNHQLVFVTNSSVRASVQAAGGWTFETAATFNAAIVANSTITGSSGVSLTGGTFGMTASGVEVDYYADDLNLVGAIGTGSNHGFWIFTNGVARVLVTSTGDFNPFNHNASDLGSASKQWQDLWLAGTANIDANANVAGTLVVSSTATIGGTLTAAGNTVLGDAITDTVQIKSDSITLTGTNPKIFCSNAAASPVLALSNNAGTGNYISITDPNGNSATSATMAIMSGFTFGALRLGNSGLLTTATKGFVELPDMAGAPSGAAANTSIVIDTTNLRLYVRIAGTWRHAQLT